jgi:hypothetical protein
MSEPTENPWPIVIPGFGKIKEPRRIVQIAAIQESSQCGPQILALCNDGTAWWRLDLIGAPWNQLPEIPQ